MTTQMEVELNMGDAHIRGFNRATRNRITLSHWMYRSCGRISRKKNLSDV